jgi:hypothetical protein
LKKHDNENGRFYNLTNNQESYSRQNKALVEELVIEKEKGTAGYASKSVFAKGKRLNSVLVAE